MKTTFFRIVLTTSLFLVLGYVPSLHASDIVIIDGKYKRDAVVAPDPDFPLHAQHMQEGGQGIYRLIINTKSGLADEVKVLKSTGYRDLDASAVMTLFKWKFQPGIDHRDVLVKFNLTGWARGLH